MAEANMTMVSNNPAITSLDYVRCGATGAFTTLILFGLCWVGAAVGFTSIHGFVSLFTDQAIASGAALLAGGIAASVVGAFAGVVVSLCYDLAGRLLAR